MKRKYRRDAVTITQKSPLPNHGYQGYQACGGTGRARRPPLLIFVRGDSDGGKQGWSGKRRAQKVYGAVREQLGRDAEDMANLGRGRYCATVSQDWMMGGGVAD